MLQGEERPKVTPAPERAHAQQAVLGAILGGLIADPRAEKRGAACAWLLGLVSHAGRNEPVLARLGAIQEAFSSLLGDSNEATQVPGLQCGCP